MRHIERTDIGTTRQISLTDFLARLGHELVRRSGNELWHRAPYRNERTPSFCMNVTKRLWYDFGLGRGGDIFMLAGELARSDDSMMQARFIVGTARMLLVAAEKPLCLPESSEPAFEGVEAVPLLRSPLTDYLVERDIPYAIASRHCCRLNYGVYGKRYFAIGLPSVAGGYETRSRYFKGCALSKGVSLVKMESSPADMCSLSRGFMDFLSAATLGLETGDSLVLNFVVNVGRAVKHLDGYVRIDCSLDRDDAGRRTLEALKGRYGGRVRDRSVLYDGCRDLNEYLQLTTKNE